jgi:tetratricopeptide (TPR) repeat protein
LSTASAAFAAVDPFYAGLFERGVAHYGAGDYASAQRELRIAAFGFVDALDQFQTAHIYAALASSQVHDDGAARASVNRVVAAERLERTYPNLVLPPSIRQQFEALAKKMLSDADLALLHAPVTASAPPLAVTRATVPPPQPPSPQPQPRVQPQPQPALVTKADPPKAQPVTKVDPPTAQPVIASRAPTRPPAPAPAPVKVVQPQPVPTATSSSSSQQGSIADAEKAIASGDLNRARSILITLLDVPQTAHATMIRIGAGFYRVRDFRNAVTAFDRAGAMQPGEEINHYYFAVALYETGRYAAAKQEITAALPYIENTSDVSHYRAKIDGAISR